ncbi:MAG: hypothetical protein HN368_05310 [Spirochaetales bacterium]|jgi:hypothetical protein|nr:hypothetical protein [Spirochaetales bacterium]
MKIFISIVLGVLAFLAFSCGGAPSDSDFLEMVKTGTAEEVSAAVKKGADLDARTKRDQLTPLMVAARYNSAEVVNILIEAGAEINAVDNVENSALRYAISYNAADAVRGLADAGADVNAVAKLGITPLIVVSMRGTPEMASILIQAGADPYVADQDPTEEYRRGPIFFAEFNEKIPVVDRIELFAKPLTGSVAEMVQDLEVIAAKRPEVGPVLEGNVVLLRRQHPLTGKTETDLYIQSVSEYSDGYLAMCTVDEAGATAAVQVFPIPADIASNAKKGDLVRVSGMFHWGYYEDLANEELGRVEEYSSSYHIYFLRERFIGRAGNEPLLYVTAIEKAG